MQISHMPFNYSILRTKTMMWAIPIPESCPPIKFIYLVFPEYTFYFSTYLTLPELFPLAGITFPTFLLSQSPSIFQNLYQVFSCPNACINLSHSSQGTSRTAGFGLGVSSPLTHWLLSGSAPLPSWLSWLKCEDSWGAEE